LGKYYSAAESDADAFAKSVGNTGAIHFARWIDIADAVGFGNVRVSNHQSEAPVDKHG
jgi:hypothetical protein